MPQEGNCERLLQLLWHMCGNEANQKALYDWVVKWLAYAAIEVAFLDGITEPFLDYEEGFTFDGVRWKARLDFGIAALDYRGVQRCG